MKKILLIGIVVLITSFIFAQSLMKNQNISNTKTIIVGPTTVLCTGAGPQRCLQIKENPDNDWQNFYDQINGFEHQEGIESVIEVQVKEHENPPADASSIQYSLIQILEEIQVPYVYIESPSDFERISVKTPITISGTGRGLFENNVVVQVGGENDLIMTEVTTMKTEDVGRGGVWSVNIEVDIPESTNGTISAYSPSPKDGERDLRYTVPVTFIVE